MYSLPQLNIMKMCFVIHCLFFFHCVDFHYVNAKITDILLRSPTIKKRFWLVIIVYVYKTKPLK